MSFFSSYFGFHSKCKHFRALFLAQTRLCNCNANSCAALVLFFVSFIPFSTFAGPPAPINISVKDALVTRCADSANTANSDCQLGSVRNITTPETGPVPGARAQGSFKLRESKLTVNSLQAVTAQELTMYAGEVVVLNVGAIDRVALGNGKVASSTVLDKSRLLVIAQDVGDTNILLWDKTKLIGDIRLRVTAQNLERIKVEARNLLSEIPGLKISNVGDRIFIEGSDLTEADLGRVKALAAQYPGIIDRTVGRFRAAAATIADPSAMIMFDLYFVEFKKSYLQNLGVSWQKSFNGFNLGVYGEATDGPLLLRPGASSSGQSALPAGRVYGLSTAANVAISLPATINIAVDSGDAVLLAAPKIASRSGGKAKFTAGGEIPLPSSGIQGSNVTFKSYGILLEVEPQINGDGSVSGVVHAEVSSVDPAITVSGIPAFLTRRTEADFYSRGGEAVVLSGLYSQELSKSVDKVPLLGDIPLMGALFSSSNEARRSSELVVFIVPRVHSTINEKVLANTRLLMEEQNKKFNENESDILTKLKTTSTLWGKDLFGGAAVGRPKIGAEPLLVLPQGVPTN